MTWTVKAVAERYGVSQQTVLGWIRAAELRAINVGRTLSAGKPRWRITEDALVEFELLRTPVAPVARTHRRKRHSDVIEFYR